MAGVGVFLLWLSICGEQVLARAGDAPKPVSGSTHEVATIRLEGGDWGYPSPFAHYPRGPGGFKMALIFDSLLERDEKGLIPWLAQDYEIADGGREYRFTIRKGVIWQDGTPLSAEDARFSLEYAGRHPSTWSYVFNAIESVAVINGNQLRVRLKQPSAAMLYSLGTTRIIPKHIWQKVERPKEFLAPEAIIGSGPYRLTHYSKEHGTYRFAAFDRFWGPRQRVKAIEFVPVSEPILAYENREIDLTAVPPDLLSRFQNDPVHRLLRSPAFWGYRLLFNFERGPALKDVRVRRAMAHAIDRNELVAKVARGAALPGSPGVLPPDHVMAAPHVEPYAFDPPKAQRLLAEAGYPLNPSAGADAPLAFDLLCSADEVRLAEVLRQRLSAVGIKIKIISVDGKTRDARVKNFDYTLAIIGHGGWGGDPDYLAARFIGSGSAAPSQTGLPGFDHPELTALLIQQGTEIDPAKRRLLVERIQQLLAEQLPELALFYTTGYTVFRPAVYDGWMNMYDHHSLAHSKLSYLSRQAK
jgi:peptide/nickel transport system substrate-binding protein